MKWLILILSVTTLVSFSCKKKPCVDAPASEIPGGFYGWMSIDLRANQNDSSLWVNPQIYATPFGASGGNVGPTNCGAVFFNGDLIPYNSGWYSQVYFYIFNSPGGNSFKRNFENATFNFKHPAPEIGSVYISCNSQLPACPTPTIPGALSLSSPYVLDLGATSNCNRIIVSIDDIARFAIHENPSSKTKFTFMPSELAGMKAGDTCYVNYDLIKDSLMFFSGKPFWFSKGLTQSKKVVVTN